MLDAGRSDPSARLVAYSLFGRVLILAVVLGILRVPLSVWHSQSDAPSYIAAARTLVGMPAAQQSWDQRVFWGWPIVIAPFLFLLHGDFAALLLALLAAAAVPVLMWKSTGDWPSAFLISLFPPAWLLQSCFGMSEAAYLALALAGVLSFVRRREILAAVFVGLAGLTRPTAVFLWIAVEFCLLRRKAWSKAVAVAVVSGAIAGSGFLINGIVYDDPLRQFAVHSHTPNLASQTKTALGLTDADEGQWGRPFKWLVLTPLRTPTPLWKVIYVGVHVFAVLLMCVMGFRRTHDELTMLFWTWAVLNTAYIVSTGPYWAFHSFDRYTLWALPAYIHLAGPQLAKSGRLVAVLCGCSVLAVLAKVTAEMTTAGLPGLP